MCKKSLTTAMGECFYPRPHVHEIRIRPLTFSCHKLNAATFDTPCVGFEIFVSSWFASAIFEAERVLWIMWIANWSIWKLLYFLLVLKGIFCDLLFYFIGDGGLFCNYPKDYLKFSVGFLFVCLFWSHPYHREISLLLAGKKYTVMNLMIFSFLF